MVPDYLIDLLKNRILGMEQSKSFNHNDNLLTEAAKVVICESQVVLSKLKVNDKCQEQALRVSVEETT
jgi:hypothetical protein